MFAIDYAERQSQVVVYREKVPKKLQCPQHVPILFHNLRTHIVASFPGEMLVAILMHGGTNSACMLFLNIVYYFFQAKNKYFSNTATFRSAKKT